MLQVEAEAEASDAAQHDDSATEPEPIDPSDWVAESFGSSGSRATSLRSLVSSANQAKSATQACFSTVPRSVLEILVWTGNPGDMPAFDMVILPQNLSSRNG